VFKLKTRGADGRSLWAYRYRLEGRGSTRPQFGGFATREQAEKALRKVLDRLGPGGGAATMTLGDLVDEFLEIHQAEPVTRGCAARRSLAEAGVCVAADGAGGHRFEATQALRQVLNLRSTGVSSTPTRPSAASATLRGVRGRSDRSSRGNRSKLSPRSSARSTGR
jgi:hypothetical protein